MSAEEADEPFWPGFTCTGDMGECGLLYAYRYLVRRKNQRTKDGIPILRDEISVQRDVLRNGRQDAILGDTADAVYSGETLDGRGED